MTRRPGTAARLRLGPIEFTPGSLTAITSAVDAHLRAATKTSIPSPNPSDALTSQALTTQPLVIGYVNPHVVSVASLKPAVRQHLQRADFTCVDGVGTSLVLRGRGIPVERLPAHRLLDHLLGLPSFQGSMVAIGIEKHLIERAAGAIAAARPDLEMAGSLDGFAAASEVEGFLREHRGVNIVLIGASSPKSEQIAEIAAEYCDHAVVFHCGAGSLKVWAQARRHAPRWINRIGLDWLYRFVREPETRTRYTLGSISFLRALRQGVGRVEPTPVGGRATDPDDTRPWGSDLDIHRESTSRITAGPVTAGASNTTMASPTSGAPR